MEIYIHAYCRNHYSKIILDKITEWLKEEVIDNQDIVDAYDNGDNAITTSGDDDILYLMEDAATGEIRLSILWEWLHRVSRAAAELGRKHFETAPLQLH